jgi:hypothetical protein
MNAVSLELERKMAKYPSWSLFSETYRAEIAAVECGKDQ